MSKNTTNAKLPPTLIIGLGGTGCEIVSRVDKLSTPEQRKYMRFVFFDTDANELRVRKQESPYIYTVQTSRKLTVGQALRSDVEARERSFPTSLQLLSKPLTEGAGQVRAVSKLAFDACLREGRITPLHDAIHELQKLNGDNMEQSMRVVIVSTLVGGTGSGILLPVSMYLRDYLENVCQKKPIIRGFCVLPDVFFHGSNKPDVEKNNLRANAYATLRELDAFMLKADSSREAKSSDKYWLKMPTPGTVNEYDEYAVNPMDFCFLFDGQNMDGDGLRNLELYKQHAADCIYSSSVSILNKRLNSSEDNTILQRCAENGRNRYCGIGTSKIVYPFEQVRDYLAMKWMSQSMTDEWLRYDRKYKDKLVQQQISKATRGVMHPPIEKRKYYCDSINSDQGEGNYFAFALYEECYNKDKRGVSFTDPRWISYYDKLSAFIEDKVAEDVGYDDGLIETIEQHLAQLSTCAVGNNVEDFFSAYTPVTSKLKAYFTLTKRHSEDIAGIVADSIFSPYNFDITSEHHLEHWLTRDGIPIHPNAARYFLYNLEMLLKEHRRRLTTPANETETVDEESENLSFADLEKEIRTFFDAKNYSLQMSNDVTANVDIDTYAASLKKKLGIVAGTEIDKMNAIATACRNHNDNIRKYYEVYLRLTIINSALEYIDQLSSNYEYFYQQLEVEIKRIPLRIQRIEESFVNDAGNPIMYACASADCLKGLSELCPNVVDPIMLTESFKRELFNCIFSTLKLTDKEKQKSVIEDMISGKILDFWRKEVIDQYGKVVDMDIIDALKMQAQLEKKMTDPQEQQYYIEDICEEAYKLAAPFIDRPIGQEPYIIEACSLGSEVTETEDVQKTLLIKNIFPSCEKDELMDKYQIIFMKALYNLKIEDLPKFAPEDTLWVDPHDDGTYFKAYWKRINEVIPDDKRTRVLTPHIDKRWHYVGVMPDLSAKTEEMCLKDAHRALFISIAYGRVKYDRDQYRFKGEKGDFLSDNIVVGDGKCNKFSEIYEAMLMSRPLVREQLEYYAKELAREKNTSAFGNIDYKSTMLYKQLNNTVLEPYFAGKISFLELPLLYKVTAGGNLHSDDESITMLRNMIDFIEEYLTEFYSDKLDRTPFFVQWLYDQTKLMCDNLRKNYGKIHARPFADPLVKRIKSVLEARVKACCENCPLDDDSVAKYLDALETDFANVKAEE